MSKLERWSAWVLLINGALGLAVPAGIAVVQGSATGWLDSPPYLSLLGGFAGILALRGWLAGLVGGLLFYALQIPSYYSHDFQFNFRSGISYAAVLELRGGVLVVNVAAIAGLAVIALILARRPKTAKPGTDHGFKKTGDRPRFRWKR